MPMLASAATPRIAGEIAGGRHIPMSSAARIVVPSVRPNRSVFACAKLGPKPCRRLVQTASTEQHSTTSHAMFQIMPSPFCQAMASMPGISAKETRCISAPVRIVAGTLRVVRLMSPPSRCALTLRTIAGPVAGPVAGRDVVHVDPWPGFVRRLAAVDVFGSVS